MARSPKASPAKKPGGAPSSPQKGGLVWPLWTAAILGALYLAAHASMVPTALSMWGGLLSALVLGR